MQVVRLFRPYGPGPDRSTVNRVLRRALLGEKIQISRPDGPLIQPVFVEDVCKVIATLSRLEKSAVVDVAGRERLSLKELIRRWADVTGVAVKWQMAPDRAVHDRKVFTSGLAEIDALVTTPIDQGLQIMRSWFSSIDDESSRSQ